MSPYDEWKTRTPEEDRDIRRSRRHRDPDDGPPDIECPACGEIVPDDLDDHDGVCHQCWKKRIDDDEPDDEEDTPEEPTPIEPPEAIYIMDEWTELFLDQGNSSGG
jgi:hypothetical protein